MREFISLPDHLERTVLTRNGSFRVESGPVPELAPGDLLFRLVAAGITAEDVSPSLYGGRTPPGIPVGEIAAVGEDVGGWSPLDRALLLRPPLLPSMPPLNGLANYVHVPAALDKRDLDVRLSAEIPAEEATLLPAAAMAVRILREAQVPAGGRLLVLGLGLVGQIVVLLARHQRVDQIYAGDVSATLRRKAEWSGATRMVQLPHEWVTDAVTSTIGDSGVHAAVVLLPDAALIHQAFATLGVGGSLVLGAEFPASILMAIPAARIHSREIRMQGVRRFTERDMRDAIQAVRQGVVNAETLVSKRIAWDELQEVSLNDDYWYHGTHVVLEGPA